MSGNKEKSLKAIEKEEYELQFYDFTIGQFRKESQEYMKTKITNGINKKIEKMVGIAKSKNPPASEEFIKEIQEAGKETVQDLIKKIEPKTRLLENEIEDNLGIPENVVLEECGDLRDYSEEFVKKLQVECEELETSVKQIAFFLQTLQEEYNSYQQLSELIEDEKILESHVENSLNTVVDIEKSQNISEKLSVLK